jgi:hypothetical protein
MIFVKSPKSRINLVMQNKQDITVNNVSSLRDLVRKDDCRCRRLRYASPTVNKVSPLQGFSHKSRRDGTLLTVGEAEGSAYGRDNGYILFVFHDLSR